MTSHQDATVISQSEPLADKGETPLMVFVKEVLLSHDLKESWGESFPVSLELQSLANLNLSDTSAILLKIANHCQHSQIGKKLPVALYLHISALESLDPLLKCYESCGSRALENSVQANVIKFHTNQLKISYLFYPDFDSDPHPALEASTQINLATGKINYHDYRSSDNPPILHRKETFVTPNYPEYETFSKLTRSEEELGLLDNTRTIGTRRKWLHLLQEFGVEIQGHAVVEITNNSANFPSKTLKIERHKAAMFRKELSKPVRLALESNLFTEGTTFFDYGCGYGSDIKHISEQGYAATGWDPYYQPDTNRTPADIINLGYVINVIESQGERREALINAWELTKKVLIVAAQVLIDDRIRGQIAYGDGVITSRNTFQKYYEQEELKSYIDQVLNVDSIPVALGIYFVFREEAEAESFRASRFHRRLSTPRVCLPSKRFEDYQEILAPLMAFVSERGRLPVSGELPEEAIIKAEFRNSKAAFKVILQATDPQEWETIANKRRQDLLVYISLANLGKILPIKKLAPQIKNDIKELFGSYKRACILADLMLFSLGNQEIIADCCRSSPIGRKRNHALFIHVSALEELDPLLRLYEGCANRTIGRLDGATLIKLNAKKPIISYLFYPEFDTEAHPALHTAMHINLRNFSVTYEDYSISINPPVLDRKETYVTANYPYYQKFAQFSYQEEVLGLFDRGQTLRTRNDWVNSLQEHCVKIKNHRLVWRSDADPEQVKQMKAAMTERLQRQKAMAEKCQQEVTATSSELTREPPEENESNLVENVASLTPSSPPDLG
ncbi:MAG: DNA phosphorothioation-associated putative methyltransferase [Actinomycetota bacterium]